MKWSEGREYECVTIGTGKSTESAETTRKESKAAMQSTTIDTKSKAAAAPILGRTAVTTFAPRLRGWSRVAVSQRASDFFDAEAFRLRRLTLACYCVSPSRRIAYCRKTQEKGLAISLMKQLALY